MPIYPIFFSALVLTIHVSTTTDWDTIQNTDRAHAVQTITARLERRPLWWTVTDATNAPNTIEVRDIRRTDTTRTVTLEVRRDGEVRLFSATGPTVELAAGLAADDATAWLRHHDRAPDLARRKASLTAPE